MNGSRPTRPCVNCGVTDADRRGALWLCRDCFDSERRRIIRFLVLIGDQPIDEIPELEMRAIYGDK